MNRTLTALVTIFAFSAAFASEIEMADTFRSEGKIYVVVAVLSVILIGVFIFLFRIEKKLKSIEETRKEK